LYSLTISFSHSTSEAEVILDELCALELPRLKILSLGKDGKNSYSNDTTITNDHLNKFLRNCSQLAVMEAPRCNDETLAIISEKKHRIREINVNTEQITEEGLLSLHQAARKSLETLRIMDAKLTSNEKMIIFLRDCSDLTHVFINLRGYGPNDELIDTICQSCPRIETAILGGKGLPNQPVNGETVKRFVRNAKFLKLLVMDIGPIQSEEIEKLQEECRKSGRLAPRLVMSVMSKPIIPQRRSNHKCIIM
jgi:hypothetical protein